MEEFKVGEENKSTCPLEPPHSPHMSLAQTPKLARLKRSSRPFLSGLPRGCFKHRAMQERESRHANKLRPFSFPGSLVEFSVSNQTHPNCTRTTYTALLHGQYSPASRILVLVTCMDYVRKAGLPRDKKNTHD